MRLDIAGFRVDLEAAPGIPLRVHERYGAFSGARGPAGWRFDLQPGSPVPPESPRGRVTRRDGRLVVDDMEYLGHLDPETRSAEIVLDPWLLALERLLRAALHLDILGRGGCILHAASVVVGGRAHVFPGRSGAGKSTLAALAGDTLCDELCAIVPTANGFEAHGTPWWKGRPGSAPLDTVYALAWDGESVVPLPRRQLMAHLASSVVLAVDEPWERKAAFTAVSRMAANVPFARLSFRRDSDIDALLHARRAA